MVTDRDGRVLIVSGDDVLRSLLAEAIGGAGWEAVECRRWPLEAASGAIIIADQDDPAPGWGGRTDRCWRRITLGGEAVGSRYALPKPVRVADLLAALEEIRQAASGWRGAGFRLEGRALRVGGKTIGLTEKEAALLDRLCRARGRPLSRDVLLRDVWEYREDLETHTLESHLYRLRRKIAPLDIRRTARGYVLDGAD